jgi:anti-sigma B factor antagonist
MARLTIDRVQLEGATVVVRVDGDLDAFSVADFRQAMVADRVASRLIIELGAVFFDSAGLNALVTAIRQVREHGGEAAIACAHPTTSRLLDNTGFDRIVTRTRTVDEARFALRDAGRSPVEVTAA